ncbi:hypothetical protein GCM10011354_35300 [Egicoccus halophilus]|uniref:Uncharacterized protein n=2 Tax=Egicoccus halophilus TaxID=1670830 RepID=A0A8J3ADJ5_9ACTN|nr:hypothetical protein GCM10011354_35300 [Egicoccus halophilus]
MPGSRRAVPDHLDAAQCARLRWLLEDPDHWVRRNRWERFLLQGDESVVVRTDSLTSDQRAAALAWLRQQRHRLHAALEGGRRAPEGWLEAFPLYDRLGGEFGHLTARR